MKRFIYLLVFAIFVSCSSRKELYTITDSFVENLYTTYESYGLLGGIDHKKVTSDKQYQVFPVGRLINVKILKAVSDDVYKDLKDDLIRHYKGNERVNDIYINEAGTIMIDCRN